MSDLSKSKYTTFCQCQKALWLKTYKPEVEVFDDTRQAIKRITVPLTFLRKPTKDGASTK